MTKLLSGNRIGKQAVLRAGASAIIFDDAHQKVLLTKRADNGRWCLPGGGMDPGESIEETCVREVLEETGLKVRVIRLVGVYTSPDLIIEYPDGNLIQPVAFSFEAEVTGGELALSDETTAYGYFTLNEIDSLDFMELHKGRVQDALQKREAAFIK
mgnify:CR=1 FL=1